MDILKYTGTTIVQRATSLPTLTGDSHEKGKTGVVAQIYVGNKFFVVPVDPVTGLYTWTATEPLPDGDYSVSISTKDRAGNIGAPLLVTMRVDTTPPEAPVLLNLYDDQGGSKGSFDPGQTTDDKRPKLTGVAQEGTLVYLRDADGNTIGSARADKVTGIWEMEPDVDLKDGDNTLTLVAEETFNNVTREGPSSAAFTIVIGADGGKLPPDTITINQAIDDAGSVTGVLKSGALTDDTTPTLSGSVSEGSTVIVYYRLAGNSTWAGSATATVTGEGWSWTPGSALAYGNYEFQASIGNTSSALFSLEIATASDIALRTRIESVQDDFGAWQGPLTSGAITDDATPSFSGRGEANGKVVVRYGQPGQTPNTVVVDVDSSGHWKWTPATGLPTGNWDFDVQPQGHNAWSSTFSLNITGTGGYNPVITHAYDDEGTPAQLANGDTTDDTTPTLFGRAEANSSLILRYTNGNGNYASVQVEADSGGNWSWTSPVLQNGSWTFEVSKTGQTSWTGLSLIVDSASDINPAITYAADDVGSKQDPLHDGDTTDDTTPTLHGTAANNGLVYIKATNGADSQVFSVKADAAGTWQWTPSSNLALGDWSFQVSKSKNSGFGDAFDLNIAKGDDSSGFLDLENLNLGAIDGRKSYLNNDVYATAQHKSSYYAKISGIPEFGSALRVGPYLAYGNSSQQSLAVHFSKNLKNDQTKIQPSEIYAKYIDFQIANPTDSAMTSVMTLQIYRDAINLDYQTLTLNVTLGPHEVKTISSDDFKYVPGTYFIGTVHFHSDVYVDNINYTFNNASTSFSTLSEVDDAIHLLDGIEEINQSPITGKEFQIDTLQLTGKDQILDLNVLSSKIESIEVFDITGSGDNTLKLDLTTLLQHGEKDLFIEDGKTQLMVKGNEGDVVQLKDILPEGSDISEWQHQEGTVTVAGVEYNVYSHDDAELLVQQGVKTELI